MSKKLKKRLIRILTGGFVFALVTFLNVYFELPVYVLLPGYLIAYFITGGDIVKKALTNIIKGQIFDENFLMVLATVGAFLIKEYPEAVAVMLFYQVGEWFQSFAVNKSRKSITALMDMKPDFANVIRSEGILCVDPAEVEVDEMILVKPGEKIPLDGVVIKGASSVDTKALTGESLPREVFEGEKVMSGCINISGVLEVKVYSKYGESTVAKILDLVENANSKKAESEDFISKFAKYYTPVVVILAVLLALVPTLFFGEPFTKWVYRAFSFLVISCPCALVISIPLSFFGGIGGASKVGVLIKGSNYLEALSKTETLLLDKTGTLTKGNFVIQEIIPNPSANISEEELLELAFYAESYSNHPISKSLESRYKKERVEGRVELAEEIAGYGISAVVDGQRIFVGSARLMERQNIKITNVIKSGTILHIATEQEYLGYILIADEIREDALLAIRGIQKMGIGKIVMLTGDNQVIAKKVADELGIKEVYAELLPGDKVEVVERLFQSKSSEGKLVFVGDGMNDAPVLARADIGIAMGGLGSDAAIEAADIVIMTDEPSKIATAIMISKKTLGIVKQNIVFAIGIKVLVLILAAVGIANMWLAVFADVGVAVIAILNAMRAMHIKVRV